jgi:serine/threonine protein kinase
VILKHIREPPPPPDPAPPSLAAVILRMMAKSPADRFATYDELRAALSACLDGA